MNAFRCACTGALYLVYYLCCVTCELNLADGSPCISEGLNGTCVSVYRCRTAALSYIYRKAGYDRYIPELPEICSYKNETPIVCCTDCTIKDEEIYKDHAVNVKGEFVKKAGPKAHNKCLDYLQTLPYPCRGQAGVRIRNVLNNEGTCHLSEMSGWLAVGGRPAERWEFPHMALLGYGDDQTTAQWLCGGSVISEKFILTAGHCVGTKELGPVSFAALGLLKRSDPLEYWKVYKIKRVIRHPEYNPPSKYHDIALLETETELSFSRDILPACLNTGHTIVPEKDQADASGWGQLGHRNPLADTLQVVTLYEYSQETCASEFPVHRHLKQGYNHTTQMCYGSRYNVSDTCQGDSGGPLQIDENKCQYTVVGVTSFGRSCGIIGSPAIYTRVLHYVPWIESIVWPD